MPIDPRPAVLQTALDAHGSAQARELEALGLDPTRLVDFSSNINPYGPAPEVIAAVHRTEFAAYPDPDCLALRRVLADQHELEMEQIMAGNGTAELIWLLAFAFLSPTDRVLVVGPTFGEYARAAALMGALVDEVRADSADNFVVDVAAVDASLQRDPKLCFLCNPNNPTGVVMPLEQIDEWAKRSPQTLFMIDEAYIDFVPEMHSALTLCAENVLVLRSLTKTHALAGLRIGYALGSKKVIHALRQVQPPWSVNALAQAAGVAAIGATEFVRKSLGRLARDAAELRTALTMIGYEPVAGETPYFLIDVGDGTAVRSRLLEQELMVRDCASFGLPQYVRVSAQLVEQNVSLMKALRRRS